MRVINEIELKQGDIVIIDLSHEEILSASDLWFQHHWHGTKRRVLATYDNVAEISCQPEHFTSSARRRFFFNQLIRLCG